MSSFKARGIVLREVYVGEYDKILTLLLKDIGKVSVSARGVRKPKSKLMSATTLFCYADYIIYTGGKYYSISQADTIDGFYNLRNDLETLAYGTFFLELIDKTILEDNPANDILHLLIKSLYQLTKSTVPPQLIARIFELKYLQYNGYTPQTNCCVICGNNTDNLSISSEGIVCENCINLSSYTKQISHTCLYTINYILSSDLDHLFTFSVSDDTLKQLKAVNELLFNTHISVKLKSYDFIKELELG